ncbi:MAG TPA: hypothetical protein VFX30_08950 [bacterium]|nr:hypothetical protein [bacterium]
MKGTTQKKTIVHHFIKELVQIYPQSLRTFLRKGDFVLKPQRFLDGEKIDGSYDIETGEIILWEPDLEDREGLFLIITHEWGHKIYHERLSGHEIEKWLRIRSFEKIDFDLKMAYPAVKHPEEEFCTLFSLVSLVRYWNKKGMKTRSKKLAAKLRSEFPRATRSIEKYISKKSPRPKNAGNHITHTEVEKLKAWVNKAIAN